ncbi:hypothetical protein [Luteimonas abyssi]|uniref:hypothetical protein n=1 Tax=Luteimonas abyssi TaxID=1247514 RepID=UPI000737BC62|nr:hypothetical protein [Luteimonas abyssi]
MNVIHASANARREALAAALVAARQQRPDAAASRPRASFAHGYARPAYIAVQSSPRFRLS